MERPVVAATLAVAPEQNNTTAADASPTPKKKSPLQRLVATFRNNSNTDDRATSDGESGTNHRWTIGSIPATRTFRPLPQKDTNKIVLCKPVAPSRQRTCLGHEGRILSVDWSADQRYFATASEDSTARIWCASDNDANCIATLVDGHSTQHEILRVAWATAPCQARLNHNRNDDDDDDDEQGTNNHTYWLAAAGSDGKVHLWCSTTPSEGDAGDHNDPAEWSLQLTLDHAALVTRDNHDDQEDTPQVYVLEWIDNWHGLDPGYYFARPPEEPYHKPPVPVLLTSSDDHVHVWELQSSLSSSDNNEGNPQPFVSSISPTCRVRLNEIFSIRFRLCSDDHPHHAAQGVTVGRLSFGDDKYSPSFPPMPGPNYVETDEEKVFGGKARNPHGIVFVFDSAYAAELGSLGVALSDGSVRIVNGRGQCWSILTVPYHLQCYIRQSGPSHVTALAWCETTNHSSTARPEQQVPLLAVAMGTGEIVTWQIWPGYPPACRSIFAGGHQPGRPVFGLTYWGSAGADTGGDEKDDGDDKDSSSSQRLLLSWGVDGRLVVWDAEMYGMVEKPLATLRDDTDYPLYDVAMGPNAVVAAGGGVDTGIMSVGNPVYLYPLVSS